MLFAIFKRKKTVPQKASIGKRKKVLGDAFMAANNFVFQIVH